MRPTPNARAKKSELLAFLFLTVLLAPLAVTAGIGGYGLLLWILQ